MRIRSDGNVGIGTTSPAYRLDIIGDIRTTNALRADNLYCVNTGATNWIYGATTFIGNAPSNGAGHEFFSSGEAHIGIGGNVGVGTISPAYKLDVAGSIGLNQNTLYLSGSSWLKWNYESAETYINGGLGEGIVLRFGDPNRKMRFSHDGSSSSMFSYGNMRLDASNDIIIADEIRPSTNSMRLGGAGTRWLKVYTTDLDATGSFVTFTGLGSGAGTTVVIDGSGKLLRFSSSERYKANIEKLGTDPYRVLQLEPVRFSWKTTGEPDVGLIAEDVAQEIPDLVIYDKEGKPDAVKYDRVAIYLLEIVKTQQERIATLEKEIDDLKGVKLGARDEN